MLSIFDEILHCFVDMAPDRSICPLYAADAALVTLSLFIVTAAVYVALTMRNVLP